jgi:LPXTG-motif cell wall-anchored protein
LYPKESTVDARTVLDGGDTTSSSSSATTSSDKPKSSDPTYSDTAPDGIIFFYKRGRTANNEDQGALKGASFVLLRERSGKEEYLKKDGTWTTSVSNARHFISDENGLVTTAGINIPDGRYKFHETATSSDYYATPNAMNDMVVQVAGKTIKADNINIRKNVIYWNYPNADERRLASTYETEGLTPPANGAKKDALESATGVVKKAASAVKKVAQETLPTTGEEMGHALIYLGIGFVLTSGFLLLKKYKFDRY